MNRNQRFTREFGMHMHWIYCHSPGCLTGYGCRHCTYVQYTSLKSKQSYCKIIHPTSIFIQLNDFYTCILNVVSHTYVYGIRACTHWQKHRGFCTLVLFIELVCVCVNVSYNVHINLHVQFRHNVHCNFTGFAGK